MSPQIKAMIAAKLEEVKARKSVNTSSLDVPVNTSPKKDRHKPGYMADYMRKSRAKKKP